jgi:hypothetical protein
MHRNDREFYETLTLDALTLSEKVRRFVWQAGDQLILFGGSTEFIQLQTMERLPAGQARSRFGKGANVEQSLFAR